MTSSTQVPETIHTTEDGRTFRVRRASRQDAPALLVYAREVLNEPGLWLSYSPGEFAMGVDEEEQFIQSHEAANCLLLVAVDGERVIGSLGFQAGKLLRNRHAGSFGVSVVKDWRRLGVGSALIERLLAWASEHPEVERVALEVFETNPDAVRLYRRLGFEEEGRRRGAYRVEGRRIDAIEMALVFPPKNPATDERSRQPQPVSGD